MVKESGTSSTLAIPFYINVVMLILLAVSFPFIEPGTATYTVTLMGLGIVGFSLVLFGSLIYFEWTPFRER